MAPEPGPSLRLPDVSAGAVLVAFCLGIAVCCAFVLLGDLIGLVSDRPIPMLNLKGD